MNHAFSRRSLAAAPFLPLIRASQQPRPNILWITAEDMGPHLGACGDPYAVTPNLDRLAGRGTVYMNAWSNAPVCAPARTAIIAGMDPCALGGHHMRSLVPMPSGIQMFPAYLRQAGYYCTNNVKEDYNLAKPDGTWDESSEKAHYRNRAKGQPFFAVFNHTITHESQIRRRPHTLVHDPLRVRVPAYHPDTPEVRHDWAQYYDNITTMDGQAGKLLAELEKDGLLDDTIVFFYGDHGSGMPRSKRWPYNSGLNVCIVASIPEKFRHLAAAGYRQGGRSGRLIEFIDLAPTVLSLAGIEPLKHFHGEAFLGPFAQPPKRYLHGFRGRMDERLDNVRSVRDERYVYIRNYMLHKIYGQYLAYMWETPTTQVWERLYKEGRLNAAQRKFWEPKPPEELYDLTNDPDEVNNLAGSAAHRRILDRMRAEHRRYELAIRDAGMLAESEMHARSRGESPYDMARDPKRFDGARLLDAAQLASGMDPGAAPRLAKMLTDRDSGVRYWGAMGLLMRGEKTVAGHAEALTKALSDSSPAVRIAAGEALGRFGVDGALKAAMDALVPLCHPVQSGAYAAVEALNAVEAIGERARPWIAQILAMPDEDPNAPQRARSEYIRRMREMLQKRLS
jgi:uncharacterized sulfatase